MKRIVHLIILSVLVCLDFPMIAGAVSVSPVPEQRDEKITKGIRERGETVCLFQSGTADVKKTISAGDLLTVYRENEKHELKEVGKIKAQSFIGDDYLKGEVVEGEARTGDVAKKGDAASLVISSGDKCLPR
jgi:hypothetical protein